MTQTSNANLQSDLYMVVSIDQQHLQLWRGAENEILIKQWPVSTALNGTGELNGSGCTPLGKHIVRAKIGAQQPINSVFAGRRPTGEIYTSALAKAEPNRDWILSRILWLSGCEVGRNRSWNAQHELVDSMRRYIYIHGTPDTEPMGMPLSHGCIRMRNVDVIELFDWVPVGIALTIH